MGLLTSHDLFSCLPASPSTAKGKIVSYAPAWTMLSAIQPAASPQLSSSSRFDKQILTSSIELNHVTLCHGGTSQTAPHGHAEVKTGCAMCLALARPQPRWHFWAWVPPPYSSSSWPCSVTCCAQLPALASSIMVALSHALCLTTTTCSKKCLTHSWFVIFPF